MDLKTLRYTPTHEWVHLEGNVATVGITKFAVDQLTDLIMIELPAVGTRLVRRQGFRRDRERQGRQRPVRPGRRRGDRGQRRRRRQRPAPGRRPLRQGLADQGQGRSAAADTSELLDLDAYEKKVAEEGH